MSGMNCRASADAKNTAALKEFETFPAGARSIRLAALTMIKDRMARLKEILR